MTHPILPAFRRMQEDQGKGYPRAGLRLVARNEHTYCAS